jgi:CRP/FNR family cyclic AMP-dependent transcriptional regulator
MARSPFVDYLARFSSGDTIFTAGDEGRTIFVIQSGVVDLVSPSGDVLATLEKGDFFGEMSLLEGTPRTYTAVAIQEAEAIEIGAALFDRMIRSNIELAVRMLRKLSFRLADVQSRLAPAPAVTVAAPPPEAAAPAQIHDAPPPQEQPAASAPPAKAPATRAAEGVQGGWLVTPDGSEVFHITDAKVHVGRFDPVTGTRPQVDLTLLDLKRSVSRRHALMVLDDKGYRLSEEVGALNGTEMRVQNGDQVAFGGVVLKFQTVAP